MPLTCHWLLFACLLCAGTLLCVADDAAPAPAAPHARRVACVGDSLSSGFQMAHPEQEAYPVQLGKLLGTGYEVRGFAVPGRTLLRQSPRPLWSEAVFKEAQEWQPELVIICLGTNDSWPAIWDAHKAEFAPDYAAMIALFAALPSHPRVWLALPTPMFLAPDNVQLATMADQINPAIRQLATDQHCGLIDFYAPLLGHPELFQKDTVHPLPEAAAVMAKLAAAALTAPAPAK